MPDAPTGSLKSFGMPFEEGVHESDRDLNEREFGISPEGEEEAPKTPESREDKLQQLVEIEDSTVAPDPEQEETQEEDDSYEVLLDKAAGLAPQETEEEDAPRLTVSEQQLREAYAKQQGRMEALEDRIKDRKDPDPIPEVEDTGPNYEDPRVQAALAEALSDPARVGPTLKVLVETEATRLLEKQVGPLAEQLGEYQAKVEDQTQRSEASAQINTGLRKAFDLGGIEAAVIRQAEKHGPQSLLFQYLKRNPVMATTADGIVSATMLVARAVQLQEESEPLPSKSPTAAAPTLTSGKRPTTSSKRGKKLTQPKEEKTEEEVMREMIRNSRRQSSKLKFMQ